jgi:hypothetical protein
MSETVIRRAASDDVRDLATLRYSWRVDELGEQGLDAEEFESQILISVISPRKTMTPLAVGGCASRIEFLVQARSCAGRGCCKVSTCARPSATWAWARISCD